MPIDIVIAQKLLEQNKLRELLNIPADLQGKDLERACRQARVQNHPDKGGNPQLASIIGAAADKLLKTSLSCCIQDAWFESNWYYGAFDKSKQQQRPEYEDYLNNIIKIIKESLHEYSLAFALIEQAEISFRCSRSQTCLCANHKVRKLDALTGRIEAMIAKTSECKLLSHKFKCKIEQDLFNTVQDLLKQASSFEKTCKHKAYNIKVLQVQERQADKKAIKKKFKQTPASSLDEITVHCEAADLKVVPTSFPKMAVKPSETLSETDITLGRLYIDYRRALAKKHIRGLRNTDTQAATEEIQNILKRAWLIAGASGFPPSCVSKWKGCSKEQVAQLESLRAKYNTAVDTKRKRVLIDKPTVDLDIKIANLRKSAWHILQTDGLF